MAGLEFLRVVSNDEINRREQERYASVAERQAEPLITGLAAYLRKCWDAARIAKQPIHDEMLEALRQRNGEYSGSKLSEIRKQGGSEVFMMITEVKCRAAESWLRDILLDTGTTPWDLRATPIPDLTPEDMSGIDDIVAEKMMETMESLGAPPTRDDYDALRTMAEQEYRYRLLQKAQHKADRMQTKIEDQFAEGGWAESFNDFITDLVTHPAAFVKGPIVRRRKQLKWGPQGEVIVDEVLAPEYERVDPFRMYPEPGVTCLKDGYLFEHHKLSRTDLSELIGVPNYDEDAIREILKTGGGASWVSQLNEAQKEAEERKFYTEQDPTSQYDALEFWGKVSGKMLREWGLSEEEVPDEAKEYDANVWMIGNYVIRAVLNYDPLGEKPYAKTSFIKCPGAFWGKGIPKIIEDLQAVCNAAARSLVNNMAVSSGPQVEINLDRIPANEDITQMHPWKIWQVTNDPAGSSAAAVRFNQPNSNANELMGVYEKFSRLADEHSGIPAYVYGDLDVQGAGRTSSGLSMLMGAAGKSIRQVVMHIDADIVKPVVYRQFIYNMRYDEDASIKGDAQIVAKGAINLATKEVLNTRRMEFLQITANPMDAEIMGIEGRTAVLRAAAKGLELPGDEVVPTHAKTRFTDSAKANQPQESPAAMDAGGNPAGGAEGNVVQNQQTGGV